MYELVWTWGIFDDSTKWYIKIEAVDTDMYAVAYFPIDDEDPSRFYESTNSELLHKLVEIENSDLYFRCRDIKNMNFGLKDKFDEITVANFM